MTAIPTGRDDLDKTAIGPIRSATQGTHRWSQRHTWEPALDRRVCIQCGKVEEACRQRYCENWTDSADGYCHRHAVPERD
jgi:hypothetical protein